MNAITEIYTDLRDAKARTECLLVIVWLICAGLRLAAGDYFVALLELLLAFALLQVAALRVLRHHDAQLRRVP